MLKIQLFGKQYRAIKDYYLNGRAAVWLINDKDEDIIQLTVNIPTAMLMTDFDDDPEVSSRSSLLNHVDFLDYNTLHEALVKQKVIEDKTIGMIKQGHHVYNGIIFKKESFNKMDSIRSKEVI
ncbi:hypothetical protein [Staphylococcus simulans]|uniref:hypothetical protein n=1 Tax=Staphylococcus simulans TaxID=1286 RepID=UPI0021D16816|nr:hypothetical protein [Staphylococcus simulans]UXV38787.1 hypothetical protein MUA87_12540 [Staphylococcus simulans]UXV41209.1 hypothetical protein MUA56_12760 [Staphylococcus simulans]